MYRIVAPPERRAASLPPIPQRFQPSAPYPSLNLFSHFLSLITLLLFPPHPFSSYLILSCPNSFPYPPLLPPFFLSSPLSFSTTPPPHPPPPHNEPGPAVRSLAASLPTLADQEPTSASASNLARTWGLNQLADRLGEMSDVVVRDIAMGVSEHSLHGPEQHGCDWVNVKKRPVVADANTRLSAGSDREFLANAASLIRD